MAKAQTTKHVSWPFAPTAVDLNTDTNLLKIIAMIAMMVDHAGKMLFPQYYIMRIIGRIAFPIYAYCIAVGCVYTKNALKYLERIVLLALISQPLYAVAMAHGTQLMYAVSFAENPVRAVLNFYLQSWAKPSIFVSLAVGILVIWSLREKHIVLTVALAVLVWKVQASLDYGWRGIVLMVLFYVTCQYRILSLPIVLGYMLWWASLGSQYTVFGFTFGVQLFACNALVPIYLHTKSGLKINKWVFYWYYPAHLILIYILDHFVMV